MQPADVAAANRSNRQPTAELSVAIQALHAAIASEPEPEDKAALSQALQIVLKVQAKNMMEQRGGQVSGGQQGQTGGGQMAAAPR